MPSLLNYCPCPVQRISLTPRTSRLYACISLSTWAMLPQWYSVRTFQVPILVMLLALKIRLFEVKTSFRLWSTPVMDPPSASSGWRLLLPCLVCIQEWLPLAVSVNAEFQFAEFQLPVGSGLGIRLRLGPGSGIGLWRGIKLGLKFGELKRNRRFCITCLWEDLECRPEKLDNGLDWCRRDKMTKERRTASDRCG